MFRRLSAWLLRISSGWTLAAATAAYVYFLATVMPAQSAASQAYAGEWGAPDRHFFFTPDELYGALVLWGAAGRQDYVEFRLGMDIAWAVVYTAFLVLAIGCAVRYAFAGADRRRILNLVPLALDKLRKRFNADAETRPPRVPYKETISALAEGHHRHNKQTGGAGQFGEVYIRIAPLERGAGFEFADETKGGVIPGQFIPAVEKGVRLAMEEGVVAGFVMQDIRVAVYDGKYHDVDSKEIAFVTAGKKAFREAAAKAKPIVLEPIVNLELVVPSDSVGNVAGDLSGRRGQVSGSQTLPNGMMSIRATAPLAELSDYAGKLKSLTGGSGSYTLEFSHYQAVPFNIQQALAQEFKPKEEED